MDDYGGISFLHKATCQHVSLTLTFIEEPVRDVDVWGDDLADTLADQHHHQEPTWP